MRGLDLDTPTAQAAVALGAIVGLYALGAPLLAAVGIGLGVVVLLVVLDA